MSRIRIRMRLKISNFADNASPCTTSKFTSQNKESPPAIDNFLKIVAIWG